MKIKRADAGLRRALVDIVKQLDARGLNRGSTGNVSVRGADDTAGFWITPTGMNPDALRATDLVWVDSSGEAQGRWLPSSEWHFHRAIYQARPDLNAVVHVHSTHATALASLRRPLPAFHYMVAVAGGDSVPCIPYALFGTEALSAAVAAVFVDRQACLMANHGLVAGGGSLAQALKVTVEIEALCQAYLLALSVGKPALLSKKQMAEVIEKFKTYGQARRK
jgi:L-fuculose-phosphate aldolase